MGTMESPSVRRTWASVYYDKKNFFNPYKRIKINRYLSLLPVVGQKLDPE